LKRIVDLIFLHRNIVASFLSRCTRGDNNDEEKDRPNELPRERVTCEDSVVQWLERLSTHDHTEQIEGEDRGVRGFQEADEETKDRELPELPYMETVNNSSARKLLLTNLKREIMLGLPERGKGATIRQQLLSSLPHPAKISHSQIVQSYNAEFFLPWDPESFVRQQNYSTTLEEVIDSVITLTGAKKDAQALTCSQYIYQTWPSTGRYSLQLLKDVLHQHQRFEQEKTGTVTPFKHLVIIY
jgi:hypothetical protein